MLLEPFNLKGLPLRNRVVMPPMCNYMVKNKDGIVTEYHLQHYLSRAIGGVGLIIQEATAVAPNGRISEFDLGLWSDEQRDKLVPLVKAVQQEGAAILIQLAHAGRKNQIEGDKLLAPCAVPFSSHYAMPKEMTLEDIKEAQNAFIQAAHRALEAGFDGIEIHAAHGYLLNSFLSPATNKRTDEYGGSTVNRVRIIKEILEEIKKFYPKDKLLFIRISAEDYAPSHEESMHPQEMAEALNLIKDLVDVVHVSSGGVVSHQKIEDYPLYQVDFARYLKEKTGITTIAVGKIRTLEEANYVLKTKAADMVAFGRELLRNPYLVAKYKPTIMEVYPSLKRGFNEF